jgi:hypothetical protein
MWESRHLRRLSRRPLEGDPLSRPPRICFRRLLERVFAFLRTEVESLTAILARKLQNIRGFLIDTHSADWINHHKNPPCEKSGAADYRAREVAACPYGFVGTPADSRGTGETSALVTLEILHCFFMLLRGRSRIECPKISTAACLGIFFARVQAVLPRL